MMLLISNYAILERAHYVFKGLNSFQRRDRSFLVVNLKSASKENLQIITHDLFSSSQFTILSDKSWSSGIPARLSSRVMFVLLNGGRAKIIYEFVNTTPESNDRWSHVLRGTYLYSIDPLYGLVFTTEDRQAEIKKLVSRPLMLRSWSKQIGDWNAGIFAIGPPHGVDKFPMRKGYGFTFSLQPN